MGEAKRRKQLQGINYGRPPSVLISESDSDGLFSIYTDTGLNLESNISSKSLACEFREWYENEMKERRFPKTQAEVYGWKSKSKNLESKPHLQTSSDKVEVDIRTTMLNSMAYAICNLSGYGNAPR